MTKKEFIDKHKNYKCVLLDMGYSEKYLERYTFDYKLPARFLKRYTFYIKDTHLQNKHTHKNTHLEQKTTQNNKMCNFEKGKNTHFDKKDTQNKSKDTQKDKNKHIITAQEGKQTQFLSTSADIAFYGGSAGGGKTYALILEAVRNINVDGFGAVIFRKEYTQIIKEGGLWDTAMNIYPQIGGEGVGKEYFRFKGCGNNKITFSHLTRDDDVLKWQGTQIPLICFDELTHFSKKQFFYMLSRNRSMCGVKPYVRATTNPDPDSWVREFIDWWIDENGYAIEERSGVIRWFVNQNNEIHWFDSKEEANRAYPNIPPKSFTFISSNIYDNKILMESDPNYIANLEALPRVDRLRLLKGNWNEKEASGDYFKREYFEVVDEVPKLVKTVRCWDLASTEPSVNNPDPDWTVGLKGGIDTSGIFYITDMVRFRKNTGEVERIYVNTTTQDGKANHHATIPTDAGSAGKSYAKHLIKLVAGYPVFAKNVTGSKETRAKPASAQAQVGNIKILRAKWNNVFFKELEEFPFGVHDDIVDALSDVVDELTNKVQAKITNVNNKIGR